MVKVNKIFIHHGDLVDSLQFEYQLHGGSTRLGSKNGGSGGDFFTVVILEYGEKLVGIEGKIDKGDYFAIISQLTFISLKKDGSSCKYGPFGKNGNETFSVSGSIIGYYGSTVNNCLASLGVFYYK